MTSRSASGCRPACLCWSRRSPPPFSAPGLMIAAATARSGLVLYADGWGDLADGVDQELAVRAIAEAIEAPSATRSTRALTLGLSVVLGESGRRAHAQGCGADRRLWRTAATGRGGRSAGCAGDYAPVAEPPSALIH